MGTKILATSWLLLVAAHRAEAVNTQIDLSKYFKDKDGCFLLYDMKLKKVVTTFNEKRCSERFVAHSTFKVPLAVMAFNKSILKDEQSSIKWDGTKYEIEDWNHDQTAAIWMKYSVVWFSQILTPKLGMTTVKEYLKKFDYGNQDMSGGLTTAWLSDGASLKLAAKEQIRFLERLWSDELPSSKRAMELTRKITYLETSPRGVVLHGKTGSSRPTETLLGWFIGHIENPNDKNHEYVFAVNLEQPTPKEGPKFGGFIAKGIAKEILTEMGLF